jgi:hypothetical protein
VNKYFIPFSCLIIHFFTKASLLLQNGRTAHSRLKIPLNIDETSTCNIPKNSRAAKLIIAAKVIIWDEAPMVNKLTFEAVDRTLRDITGNIPYSLLFFKL